MIANLKDRVLHMQHHEFTTICDELFHFQVKNNAVYRQWCQLWPSTSLLPYPFLPIELFKTKKIVSSKQPIAKIFESSGTTGATTSKHYMQDLEFYQQHSQAIFKQFYPQYPNLHILALLPGYSTTGASSLVHMVHNLQLSSAQPSGFYLDNFDALNQQLNHLLAQQKTTLLIGVSHALLHFGEVYEQKKHAEQLIIIETGGMKGKRKELTKTELHTELKRLFGTTHIHSEYGMTELQSQAYSRENEIFELPPSMRVVITDINDPGKPLKHGLRGRLNVIDLGNIDSCGFIATQDMGISHSETRFSLLGRINNADMRGCNLLYS